MKSWFRSGAGLAVAMCSLTGLPACAGRRPIQAPMFVNAPTPLVTAPAVQLPPPQPRLVIAAPPPKASASGSESRSRADAPVSTPDAIKPFTPVDSPLLALYDSKPHGEAPKVEPEFAPSSRRAQGWQVSSYPYFGLGFGYAPYWGSGYYGYSPYYGGYYGYPRGLGVGLGLGVGFGLAARPYYGGYYGGGHYYGHSHHGHGYGGGHAHVTGGYAGRHR